MKVLAIAALMTVFAVAKDNVNVEYETRVKKTGNEVVLLVGNCVYDEDSNVYFDGGVTNTTKSGYTIRYHVCEEKVSYQVKITKAAEWYNWDSSTEVVPGSESAPFYEASEKSKTFEDVGGYDLAGDLVDVFTNKKQCLTQKDLLEQQKELDKQKDMYLECIK